MTTAATEVRVPDIGAFENVPIIEVHVKPGDHVNEEDPLITLESEKATMDIPAPQTGQVVDVGVKIGDEVSAGSLVLTLGPGDGAVAAPPTLLEQQEPDVMAPAPPAQAPAAAVTPRPDVQAPVPVHAEEAQGTPEPARDFTGVHASPSVRRTARELDVDLTAMTGTGPKGRITKDDLLGYLRGPAAAPSAAGAPEGATGIPEIPAQDFAQFGPVEIQPLSRIKKRSGPHLHRSWLNVPHVTHNDDADITVLDAYRKELDTAARSDG